MQYIRMREMVTVCNALIEKQLVEPTDCVSARMSDGTILFANPTLKEGATVFEIDQIVKMEEGQKDERFGCAALHEAVYRAREDIHAIITNHAPFCTAIAKTESSFPAVLDDVAQIIGAKVLVAEANTAEVVLKALKKNGACLIKGEGAIATGRTLDEAYTGTLVLEKGAKSYVEATILGGAKKIPLLEAKLMRFIYKTKYSKKDQSAKMKGENA